MRTTYNERIDPWLQVLWDKQGSDLLLVSGSAPEGPGRRQACDRLTTGPALTGAEIEEFVHDMLTPEQEAILEEHQDVDFSLTWQRPGSPSWQRLPPEG